MCNRYLYSTVTALVMFVALIPTGTLAQSPASAAGKPQTGLPTINLKAGGQTVRADVANTEAARQVGLMFRQKMARNEGMLFVFPEIGYHAMWMRNTLIPLAVAYVDERGAILSIHEMEPLSEVAHQSAGPARFALEMNAGWFGTNKISVGDTIKGLEQAPKPH
jgi:uncharacterized membrane protein (UPF0127 family)